MSANRNAALVPLWLHNASVRRLMMDAVRRRRARRKLERAEFEQAIRRAETSVAASS